MKKYLFIILLCVCCVRVHGQSMNMVNLVNLCNLKNKEAGETLLATKLFKLQYGVDGLNGFVIEHYQTLDKKETVIIGDGFKMANGDVLRTVSYVTDVPQNVVNLVAQSKTSNLKMTFTGADKTDNIYIYDNFLYHVVMKIAINNSKATVDVAQKVAIAN